MMNTTHIKKAKKNVLSNFLQMIFNLIINFVGRFIFIRILDASYLGINGLFSDVLQILSLADLGMNTAMMYHLYRPIAENDQKKIKQLVDFFRRIYIIIAAVILSLGILLIPFLKYIINLEQEISGLYGYYILALLNVVISYLFVYRTTLIMADQKKYLLNKYINIFKVLTFTAQVIVLVVFKNYFLYLLVALILSFICNLCQNQVALKLYPFLKENEDKLDKKESKKIFRDIKALFLYRIAGTALSNTDNILISVFVGTVHVGYYSNYSIIVTHVISLVSVIFNSIKASVGNIIAEVNVSLENKWAMYKTLELLNFWLVAFCSIALFVLSDDFIFICFGSEYVMGLSVVAAIVLNFYTSNIRQTIWVYRETTGIFEETKYVILVTAVINIILSIILGYYWGITGILYATVISRYVYAWWKEPKVLFRKIFQRKATYYYKHYIKRLVLCVGLCGITYMLANMFMFSNSYIAFGYKCLVCVIVPNIILAALYYRTDEWKMLFRIIAKK